MSLPSGYKRLEYIKSTGKQYIDTGFKPTLNTKVEFKISSSSAQPNTYPQLFGSQQLSNGTNRFGITSDWTAKTGSTGMAASTVVRDIPREGSLEYNKYVLDGVTYTATGSWTPANASLYLFSNNSADGVYDGKVTLRSAAKFYYFKMYDSGTLVRDFVPAKRNSDSVVGLYDLVSNTFYGNTGTGTFTAGPEVGAATPENFRLSSSTETTATLAWSAVDGATGYKLYRDGILIATLTDTRYTDTIQPFTSYIYTLTAYNDNGESDPATISVQVIIPPGAPSNFRASFASVAAISLAWDAVTGAESYQLSRDGVVIYTGEYPSYTDIGLTAETAYTYTLSAVNTAGSSAGTTLEAATTQLILVTDRTAADVNAGNAKGTYTAEDLNRVGAAMNYVADRLKAAGYDPHISPKMDWKNEDWVDQAAQAVYLGDLAELRKQFTMLKSTPEVPPRILATGINTNDGLTHTWANDIERILEDVDALLTNISAAWFFSGDLFSGEV